jgi:hypothetical protein
MRTFLNVDYLIVQLTKYWMDYRGVIPGRSRDFCLHYYFQTGSGEHLASYRGLIPRGLKWTEREHDH